MKIDQKFRDAIVQGDVMEARWECRQHLDDPQFTIHNTVNMAKVLKKHRGNRSVIKATVLGDLTLNFMQPSLEAALFATGHEAMVSMNDFGTLSQVLIEEPSELLTGVDVVFVLLSSLQLKMAGTEYFDNDSYFDLLVSGIAKLRESFNGPIVVSTFEAPQDLPDAIGLERKRLEVNRRLRNIKGLMVIDTDQIAASTPGPWLDWPQFYQSKLPFALEAHNHVARHFAQAYVHALYRPKALILDLDNTLWGGLAGEDGAGGIEVGRDKSVPLAFYNFQRLIKFYQSQGVILCIASKNDDTVIADKIFDVKDDMPLSLNDFSARRINWQPKSENIRSMAEELNLPLEAFVFLDDNPMEVKEVFTRCSGITTYCLPEDPAHFCVFLTERVQFDLSSTTAEDAQRTQFYQDENKRQESAKSFPSYDEFLESLKMKATSVKFEEPHMTRITQLVKKTNQFNLTTRRHEEEKIVEFAANEKAFCRGVMLEDSYGPQGLITVMVALPQSDSVLEIDTWIMSCRVFKRGVEFAFFNLLCEWAREKGFTHIEGVYLPTAKNEPVLELYPSLGFEEIGPEGEGQRYRLDLAEFQPQETKISWN